MKLFGKREKAQPRVRRLRAHEMVEKYWPAAVIPHSPMSLNGDDLATTT